jgi:hypothetical protein
LAVGAAVALDWQGSQAESQARVMPSRGLFVLLRAAVLPRTAAVHFTLLP